MQAENAQEWAMREKLGSEKLALERENKRMRSEILRLEDELRERSRPPAVAGDVDTKSLQDELACKTKVFYGFCLSRNFARKTAAYLTADSLKHVFC